MSIPRYIDYKSIKPSGFPNRVKRIEFFPQNLFSDIKPNDIVRFNINAPGFWDPYSARFRLKIDFSDMETEGSYQLDGSAQSIINELIISTNGTEIERIQEYDVLASILNDMTFSAEERNQQRHQGLNSELFDISNVKQEITQSPALALDLATGDVTVQSGSVKAGVIRGLSSKLHGFKPTVRLQDGTAPTTDSAGLSFISTSGTGTWATGGNVLSTTGGLSRPAFGKLINPADVGLNTLMPDKVNVAAVLDRADYGLYYCRDANYLEKATGNVGTFTNNVLHSREEFSTIGMTKPFNGSFSVGTFEDEFSKGVSNRVMYRGDMSYSVKQTQLYAEYSVPILSGCIGALIPKDKYKLIPAFAFDPLQIEVRVNPHAFFTSGYIATENAAQATKEGHPAFRDLSQGRQMDKTKWKIIEFAIIVDLIQFPEEVNSVVKSQLAGEGIILHSNSYSLGPLWSVANTVACQSTFQVNMGYESLKAILMCYISADYLTYSFCRKLYKLSRNVTWLQAKFGVDFYPEKALEGNGGNPDAFTKSDDVNDVYIQEVMKAFGSSNSVKPACILNKYNFAINMRPYDVTKTNPYLISGVGAEFNTSTAYGWPMVHENRCVGRGFYCIDLTANSIDKGNTIAGVNSIVNRPFDLIVKTDNFALDPVYDRPAIMYVFCHYDFLIQITNTSVKVLGRG